MERALQHLHLEEMARVLGIEKSCVVREYGMPPLPKVPSSVVYLVGHSVRPRDDEPVKIGWTTKLRRRLDNLQAGSVQPLMLLAYREGDRAVELVLHAKFEAWRIREDWFAMCDEIRGEFGLADSHSLPGVGAKRFGEPCRP